MLSLPINSRTLKRSFLGGDGTIDLQTDGDVWRNLVQNGLKFQKDPGQVDQVADLQVGVDSTKALTIGKQGGFSLDVGAGVEAANQIQLIWPNGTNQLLSDNGLSFENDQQLYLYLVLSAKGNASADGSFQAPASVNVNFGLKAGGQVSYEFFKRFDASKPATQIIPQLFADVRLPQQVDAVAEIPDPGDLLITRLGGYLDLSAGLTWGYSMTGSKSLDIRDLALELDYAIKLAASVSVGYKLAGDFEIQAMRGSEDEWVRFVVRKSKDSQFSFAADLGVDANFDLNGLPDSADDFITKLAGADAQGVLQALDRARQLSTLDALKAEVNRLAETAVDQVALKWLDRALDEQNVQEFFSIVGEVVEQYDNIDNRIIQVYENYLDRIPKLQEILGALSNLQDPNSLKQFLNETGVEVNQQAWDLVELVWGNGLYDLLLRQDEFVKFQNFVTETQSFLQDGAKQQIRDFIQTVKQELKLDPLFTELRKIDTPDKLRNLADEKLKGLVEQLVGKAFDQLSDTGFDKALQEVNVTLNKIEDFKTQWYDKLKAAASQSFNLNLSYAYTRASQRDALLDVEIKLSDPAGPELADQASKGQFKKLLQGYTSSAVKINKGVLTHNLTKSGELHVNVVGWSLDRLVNVVQNSEHAIESQAGGLLHVYTTTTSIEQSKTQGSKFKETVASKFLLKTVGATLQPEGEPDAAIDPGTKSYLVRTLQNMAVGYDLSFEDDRTRAEELTQYLQFAQLMGLLSAPAGNGGDAVAAMVGQLNNQFPDGLGKVSIEYVVRYDDQALRNAFRFSGTTIRALASVAMRSFISAKFTAMTQREWSARLGFAYLSQELADASQNNQLVNKTWSVTLPAWFTGSGPRSVQLTRSMRQILDSLFRTEKSYLDRMVEFDQLIDQVQKDREAVPLDKLDKASRDFVEMADNLDQWRLNAFFAVFDRLVQIGSGGKARRDSAMVMEIQATAGSEPVRKILTSPMSASESAELTEAALSAGSGAAATGGVTAAAVG